MRRLRPVLIVLAVVAVALGGACGGTDATTITEAPTPPVPLTRPPAAPVPRPPAADAATLQHLVLASATKAAETDSMSFAVTMEVKSPDEPMALSMTGALDSVRETMVMDMNMAGLDSTGILGDDATMRILFDGQALFVRFPAAMAADLGGKSWVKMDLDEASRLAGADFDEMLAELRRSDPMAGVGLLSGAGEDVTEVGAETLHGVATRHFQVTTDVAKALEAASASERESLSELAQAVGDTMTMDVWIDSDGLPRRLAFDLDLTGVDLPDTDDLTGTMHLQMDILEYGIPVNPQFPSPAETMDLADLLDGGW